MVNANFHIIGRYDKIQANLDVEKYLKGCCGRAKGRQGFWGQGVLSGRA